MATESENGSAAIRLPVDDCFRRPRTRYGDVRDLADSGSDRPPRIVLSAENGVE